MLNYLITAIVAVAYVGSGMLLFNTIITLATAIPTIVGLWKKNMPLLIIGLLATAFIYAVLYIYADGTGITW